MKWLSGGVFCAVCLSLAIASPASAKTYVACGLKATAKVRPVNCDLLALRGTGLPLEDMEWRAWGGKVAVGVGISGEELIRVRLYRRVRYRGELCYTRATYRAKYGVGRLAFASCGFRAGASTAKARYHRCVQNSLPPGSLGYRQVYAFKTSCSTAEDVVYSYAEENMIGDGAGRRVKLPLVNRYSPSIEWTCYTKVHYVTDGTYSSIVCKAPGGHRVRFRGYS